MIRRLAVLTLVCGCASDTFDDVPDPALSSRVAATSAEAFGIFALLHDAKTTFELLDDDVGLDARAARSLIAHRDGPDGRYGTRDDDLYETMEEVDAQYYVGAGAIDKMRAYATSRGFVPGENDVVGRWDGVSFTLREVQEVLGLSNEASEQVLDQDVDLDARAVAGILEARPLETMEALSEAYFVGASALGKLKRYAADNRLGAAWDDCNTAADCQEGLVCMGEIAWGSGIYCIDDTMYDNFTYDEEVEIPDDGTELVTSMDVTGLGTVPVDVVLTLDIEHPRPADLVVTIDNFNGYSAVVWNRTASPSADNVVYAFPSDDMANGRYNVRVIDEVSGEAGVLRGWNLYMTSNWD